METGELRNAAFAVRLSRMVRAPSFIPSFIAESHWAYWACLGAVGIFLLWRGRQRADRMSLQIGGALLGITALWIVLDSLLVTPDERLYQAHQELAQAATSQDVPRILSFFEPGTRIPVLGKVDVSTASEAIEGRLKAFGIKSNTIQNLDIQRTGTSAITQLRILTTSDFGLVPTSWRFEWMDVAGADWRIVGIDLLRVGDQQTDVIPDVR